MTKHLACPQITVYETASGDGQAPGACTVAYPAWATVTAFGNKLRIEFYPVLPAIDEEYETSVPAIYPFIELDLTCTGARELALAQLAEADRADLVGRVWVSTAIRALN